VTELRELTTLRLGGPARRLVACDDEQSLVETVQCADARADPLLVLGGGSNVVVRDSGFPGTVARVLSSGVESTPANGRVLLRVAAGVCWDAFVERCVHDGLAGLECLSGIPGLVGATPIQNVGAYGQEVSETIVTVRAYDRLSRTVQELRPQDCGFSYRSSTFKRTLDRWVVLAVTFALRPQLQSSPVRYDEVARALGIEPGGAAPLPEVRAAVLALRKHKGMVLDPEDVDTVSAGSFFLNPILSPPAFRELEARIRDRCGRDVRPPSFPHPGGRIKTSAAWLIERAGFRRGYGSPRGIAISRKHTLALTNRGEGTTAELIALARGIATTVWSDFGIELTPEPVFVGATWPSARQSR
jgi:UDP-N-acetylmuramate dehydrogenase